MNFVYEIELVCGHSQTIQFTTRMSFNEDSEVRCYECDDKDFHLIQDYVCLNDYNSFSLLMNKRW